VYFNFETIALNWTWCVQIYFLLI